MLLEKKNQPIDGKLVTRVSKRVGSASKSLSRLLTAQVRYRHFIYWNYSLVEIFNVETGKVIGRGISKRNPIDLNKSEIGETIALTRAIEDYTGVPLSAIG